MHDLSGKSEGRTDMNEAGLARLDGGYAPVAIYFSDSDCVEYVTEDAFAVCERVDHFLTLIFDETKFRLVGFKLKGFRYVFETVVRPSLEENVDFVDLHDVIERTCTAIGDEIFGNEERHRAYMAASKMAANENVRLKADYLAAA